MKNQYVGDVGDFGKHGLLRHIAKYGIQIGINWYLTENDDSKDGKHTTYLEKQNLLNCDPELFDYLSEIVSKHKEDKSILLIEEKELIPGAVFFSERLTTSKVAAKYRETIRKEWFDCSMLLLSRVNLVFADPDNGLLGKKTIRNKDSEKYVLPCEIVEYYNNGKNVVYYCHKGRRKMPEWETEKQRMKLFIPDAQIIVLTYHKGTQRSYVFVLHPDDYHEYDQILSDFEKTDWKRVFQREM